MSCIFLLRKHSGVPAKYRRKARTLCGAKPQAQTGSPREKSLIFRVGQKANTPHNLRGVANDALRLCGAANRICKEHKVRRNSVFCAI